MRLLLLLPLCLLLLSAACASTPEGEPETAEPTGEPTGEGEPSARPNAEPTGEPIGEGEPSANAEPTGEPIGEGEPTATGTAEDMESTAEPPAEESDPTSEPRSYVTTILPPVLLVVLVSGGIFMLRLNYIYTKWKLRTGRMSEDKYKKTPEEMHTCSVIMEAGVEPLLTDFDKDVLNQLSSFTNTPMDLFYIALPALVSLAVSPIIINLYTPLCTVFWSAPVAPDINDAISCFLTPAGLVYATSFGFAFQSALNKSASIFHDVTYELSLIDQIVTFTSKLSLKEPMKRLEIYRAAKAEAIFMALQIENKEPSDFENKSPEDVKVKIWSVIDVLKTINNQEGEYDREVNKTLVKHIMRHIMQLNSICSDRMGTFRHRIHWLKWVFLESLGFFSFFGVMLIKTKSTTLDLVICFITVTSISLLCYVVSDYDSPFSGFFRIDLSAVHDVVERIEAMFVRCIEGDEQLWYYPETCKSGKAMKKIWH